jgi:hypothetical protein
MERSIMDALHRKVQERRRKMRFPILILMLLLVSTFGCGPTIVEGVRIDAAKRREVIKRQTKAERVVELFGKPAQVEKLPGGEEKYIYQYYKEEFTHWWTLPRIERQKLEITIKDGVVQDYLYSRQSRDIITEEDK